MTKKLSALGYYGGKSATNKHGNIGAWISEKLPCEYKTTYVEPFAGMLGVLLQREPVIREIVNDLNGDVVHWWKMVRDHGEDLAHKIHYTPLSRSFFEECKTNLESGSLDGIDRAVAFTVVTQQSHSMNRKRWKRTFCADGGYRMIKREVIEKLRDRIYAIQLENICALSLIDRIRKLPQAVVYLDPPYEDAVTTPYGKYQVDTADLLDLISKPDNQARFALSGYGDTGDALGWPKHELNVITTVGSGQSNRTEVLWTNYDTTALVAPLFA